MAAPERYAVVSCHVERPLDDRTWGLFTRLQEARPGGFRIAALVRPADVAHGEDEAAWLERARTVSRHGPFGHHTHWTAPHHARPSGAGEPGERVLREGRRLRELGLAPTVFCGGAWYSDAGVAEACADLGYVDCTATISRPPYLPPGAARLALAAPARVVLPSGRRLLEIPSTHSLGAAVRATVSPAALPPVVHVYFHDTDLLDGRRRGAVLWALRVLARRRRASDVDELAEALSMTAPEVAFEQVAAA